MTHRDASQSRLARLLVVVLLLLGVSGLSWAPRAMAATNLQVVGFPADTALPADTPRLPYKYATAEAGLDGTPELSANMLALTVEAQDCYSGKLTRGTIAHLQACWKDYTLARGGRSAWRTYRGRYAAVFNNRNRGDAFEKAIAEAAGMATVGADGEFQLKPGWGHDKLLGGKFSEGGRRVDLFNFEPDNPARGVYELKSGTKLDGAQLRDLAKIAFDRGVPLRYVFGSKPDQSALDAIAKVNQQYRNSSDPKVAERYKAVYGDRDMAIATHQPTEQIPLAIDPATGKPIDCSAVTATFTAEPATNCAPADVLPAELDESIESPQEAAELEQLDADINDAFNRADAEQSLTPREYQPPAPQAFQPPPPPVQPPVQAPAYYPPYKPGYPAPEPVRAEPAPPYQAPASPPFAYPAPRPYVPAPAPPNWAMDETYYPPAQPVTYPYYPNVQYYYPPAQAPISYPAPPPVNAYPTPGQAPLPPYFPPAGPAWQPPPPDPQRIDIPAAPASAPPPPPLDPAPPSVYETPSYTPNLGGVDLTTLQLNSVSDLGPSSAGYSFAANTAAPAGPAYGGADKARMSLDALRTFLDLPTLTFWVNLQPGQADKIIDTNFGKTEAGRVMLEADLILKGLAHRFEYDDAQGPRDYVNALRGWTTGDPSYYRYGLCIPGARQWIDVGESASVHTEGNQLYILKIPLTVHVDFDPPYAKCDQPDDVNKNNQDAYTKFILPKIIDCVNNCPEFADLRRIYAARVAAEWFRQRNSVGKTAYSSLIDKGDVDLVRSRVPWDPFEVFHRYIGEFYKHDYPGFTKDIPLPDGKTGTINTTLVGGVVLDKAPLAEVPAEQFSQQYPSLAAAVKAAQQSPQRDDALGKLLIGSTVGSPPDGVSLVYTVEWRPWPTGSSWGFFGGGGSVADDLQKIVQRPPGYGTAGALLALLAFAIFRRRRAKPQSVPD